MPGSASSASRNAPKNRGNNRPHRPHRPPQREKVRTKGPPADGRRRNRKATVRFISRRKRTVRTMRTVSSPHFPGEEEHEPQAQGAAAELLEGIDGRRPTPYP